MEMREYLEQLLAPWKANVTFTGHVPHDNITDVFRRIDIAVLPSLWENFPIACLEAMSAARGVIGSSAGGMAEQLDGGNAGILVPPRKPKQIAAASISPCCQACGKIFPSPASKRWENFPTSLA